METKDGISNVQSNEAGQTVNYHVDPAKEAKVVRKLDLFITPILFIVYLSCFIDRSNIGM